MPLFKEPVFDAEAERDRAHRRLLAGRRSYNISLAPYVIPFAGAVLAILFACYGITRSDPSERLRRARQPAAVSPTGQPSTPDDDLVEVDLE